MLQVIENCCSSYYLDSMFYHVIQSDRWNMKYPQGRPFDEKHLKIDIIDNEIKEQFIWPKIGRLIEKYEPFLEVNKWKLKSIAISKVEEFQDGR